MLIFQSLQKAIGQLRRCHILVEQEERIWRTQDTKDIVQGHVPNIWIGVIEFPQQAVQAVDGRLPVDHFVVCNL